MWETLSTNLTVAHENICISEGANLHISHWQSLENRCLIGIQHTKIMLRCKNQGNVKYTVSKSGFIAKQKLVPTTPKHTRLSASIRTIRHQEGEARRIVYQPCYRLRFGHRKQPIAGHRSAWTQNLRSYRAPDRIIHQGRVWRRPPHRRHRRRHRHRQAAR